MTGLVRAIAAIDRTVADLARTEAFYREGLGFSRVGAPTPLPQPIVEAMGLAGRRAMRIMLRLGEQELSFLALDPPGAPYPDARRVTDPVFQHIAIPVRDMGAAMIRLSEVPHQPISEGGAQVLPASSGGVTAYKFRDPDGHPVELIGFASGEPARTWHDAPGLFLGIDHSAITVTDLDAALAFYEGVLGLANAQRGLNQGPEQARLDGIPDAIVDVVSLVPPGSATPHMELLHYRGPASPPAVSIPARPQDRATTRLVFAVGAFRPAIAAIEAAGYPMRLAPDASVAFGEGPDGHGFVLTARP